MSRASSWIAMVPILTVLILPAPVLGGGCAPLCRSFDIGNARSLPWGDTWWQGRADYNLSNLISDTEALLVPTTPVIVRMETIRRASLYASRDRKVAQQFLTSLLMRARIAEQAGRPDALAFFDAAYAANTVFQIGAYDDVSQLRELVPNVRGLVRDGDPYTIVKKSLALRPDDAGLHFGAALIASLKPDLAAYHEHSTKARAGKKEDPLLARNLRYISTF